MRSEQAARPDLSDLLRQSGERFDNATTLGPKRLPSVTSGEKSSHTNITPASLKIMRSEQAARPDLSDLLRQSGKRFDNTTTLVI
ncbi:hypothetical protein CEXT_766711 [Caerostris extrusa]|uniref:Uncharacterized protein n=1 Tax=Caerostris extrusa TaxID=172846 RepID=A0AAV4UHR3_CAEEX|nr:hypothetical protein CEXT_766711 [Caerostris extrusa]